MSEAQSIKPSQFKRENLRFSPCKWKAIGGSGPEFGRVMINYVYKKGQEPQPLNFTPCLMYNFGLQDNKDEKTGAINGYSVGLCVGMEEKHVEVKALEKALQEIYEDSKAYIVKEAKACRQDDLNTVADLTAKLFKHPIFIPRNKETRVQKPENRKLYAKAIWYGADPKKNKPEQMLTVFEKVKGWDEHKNPLREDIKEPLKDVRNPNKMLPTIQIHSIYFGTKISIQVKLFRTVVFPLPGGNTPKVNEAQLKELAEELRQAYSDTIVNSDDEPPGAREKKDSPRGGGAGAGAAKDVAEEL